MTANASDISVDLAGPNRLAVEPSPLFGGGRKTFAVDRIVNRPHQRFALIFQSQRDAIMGDAMHEIRGAVQGIGDPAVFRVIFRRFAGIVFFSEQGMIGKCA